MGPFYPEGTKPKDFLGHYARTFDTVEVDSSYYSIPAAGTVDHWAEVTPPDFLFSLKFPKSIVHAGGGAAPDGLRLLVPEATYRERDRFLEVTGRLGPKCGPLLLQFPYLAKRVFATADAFLDRLDRFLHDLPRDRRYAVEIRNRTWWGSALSDLCRHYGVALATCDQAWMPRPWELPDRALAITAPFAYARLIGDRDEIEKLTTTWSREVIDRSALLAEWTEYLAGLQAARIATLVYINNHYAGFAPATAKRLREMFAARRQQT